MSILGIGLFILAVIFAGCLLGYVWGWQDAKARLSGPSGARGSAFRKSVR